MRGIKGEDTTGEKRREYESRGEEKKDKGERRKEKRTQKRRERRKGLRKGEKREMDSEKEREETECRIKGDKIKVKEREKEVEEVEEEKKKKKKKKKKKGSLKRIRSAKIFVSHTKTFHINEIYSDYKLLYFLILMLSFIENYFIVFSSYMLKDYYFFIDF